MISLAVAAAGWVGFRSPGDYAARQFQPLPRHDPRRDHFVHGKSIKGISRNSVRKILRSGDTTFQYDRPETPMPKLGAFVERLEAMLAV